MKVFLFKVSFFVILLLALTTCLFLLNQKTYFKSKMIYAKKNILTHKTQGKKDYLLALGNSHSYDGFNSNILANVGLNLASPSQGMMEDYAILKLAFKTNPSIGKVIMAYSYHSNANRLHLSTRSEEINRMFEYAYAYNINYPKEIYTPKKILNLLANWAVYITKQPENRIELDSLGNSNAHCKQKLNIITGINERVNQQFSNRSENINTQNPYFDSISNFCLNHQIPLIVVLAPYTQAYMDRVKQIQPEAYNFIDKMANKQSSLYTLIDCRNLFKNNESLYFKDADHLSPCGRDEFSTYLKNKMQK